MSSPNILYRQTKDRSAPLTYKKPVNPVEDKVYVDLRLNGIDYKKKLKPWAAENGTNLEYYCEMKSEFEVLRNSWGFGTGAGAGPACFDVFRQLLTGNATTLWDNAVLSLGGVPRTIANFNSCVEDFITMVSNQSPRNQVTEYLTDKVLECTISCQVTLRS